MKNISPLLLPVLLLASCTSTRTSEDLESLLSNPLYAERYYEDRMTHMANLIIQNDPLLEESSMKNTIDDLRLESQENAQEANALQDAGRKGSIVSDEDYARGEVLLTGNTLFFSPDFIIVPSMDLRVYLSNVTDPRGGQFPDETMIEIGQLKNAYGAHSYDVPDDAEGNPPSFVTMVLWDTEFKRVYGFAQLR
jgi:hypothetical protein